MPHSKKELRNFKDFSEQLAIKAGKLLIKKQGKVKKVEQKDLQDISTTADYASERLIIDKIRKYHPKHSILSEEEGEINPGSEYRWIIDPLDGTKEYYRGLPTYNISITLQFNNITLLGVVYRPADNNLYSALKGEGSYLNRKKVKVSNVERIDKAFIYCYLPSYKIKKRKYLKAWKNISKLGRKVYRIRGLSDANSALSWLAHGGNEGYLNISNPQPIHDIAAGLIIAREGGAIIRDYSGKNIGDSNPDTFIAVNNEKIYNSIIKIIS
jgi:myo-inositol-1(or 4)-monophosphatase